MHTTWLLRILLPVKKSEFLAIRLLHTGTIESIYQDAIEFPSGLNLPAANITLTKNEEQITVPLANLEVIL